MNKLLSPLVVICITLLFSGIVNAQVEQQIKTEIQKRLGANVKVKSVTAAPVTGLYEVLVGNEVFYTDVAGKYLIQGEIIELATGKNITEQRQTDLNRIKWADLTRPMPSKRFAVMAAVSWQYFQIRIVVTASV